MADDNEDIYTKEGRENLEENDEIEPWEEGFMEGEKDDGTGAKCRNCGKIIVDDFVEKSIDDELMRFCSDHCVEKFERRQ